MNPLSKFVFDADDGAQLVVRSILIDGEPWFVAADVCAILTIANSRDALARLDDDEKGVGSIDTLGGTQQMTIVNESGLYSLILGSRKPEAKRFKKWVTGDVLPSIRKTGAYVDTGAQLGAASIGNPPFLSHGADIMVAADRTFRSAVRAGRSLGLSHAQAVLHANRVAAERTGVNLIDELQAHEHVQRLQAGEDLAHQRHHHQRESDADVLRFWAEYEGGGLPGGSCLPLLTVQAYALYRRWCRLQGELPVHLPRMVVVLERAAHVRSRRKRYLGADGQVRGPAAFLLPGGQLHVSAHQTEARYLGECVAAAEQMLTAYAKETSHG